MFLSLGNNSKQRSKVSNLNRPLLHTWKYSEVGAANPADLRLSHLNHDTFNISGNDSRDTWYVSE